MTGLLREDAELDRPIGSIADLADYLRPTAAEKPELVAIEIEHAPVLAATGAAAPYHGPSGVRALLTGLAETRDLEIHRDPKTAEPIGLGPKEGDPRAVPGFPFSFTIEPGGQVEYAGPPRAHLADAVLDAACWAAEAASVADGLGIRLLNLGMQPLSRCVDIEMVPKHRYSIMLPYFRRHARESDLAECMMKRTVSVQVNLDYRDEADMVDKVRTATLISPLVGAIFATSPISEGRLNGYASRRLEIWRRTDGYRCGPLTAALEPGFDFEAYARYALSVPRMFERTPAREVVAANGAPFEMERSTLADWQLHLTGIFTDVRIKQHLEVRVPDAPGPELLFAVPALFVGILYDAQARAAAQELLGGLIGPGEIGPLMGEVARHGLAAKLGGRPLGDLAAELVRLADGGLRAREAAGKELPGTASVLLEPLVERVVDRGVGALDDVLDAWEGPCGRDPAALVERFAWTREREEALASRFGDRTPTPAGASACR